MKYIRTRKKRFEVASSNVGRRVLVHALRSLEDAHGNVAAQEGEPFEKESTSMVHALEIVTPERSYLLIRAPMLQSIGAELLDDVQTLLSRDIPNTWQFSEKDRGHTMLLDFSADPGLDKRASANHAARKGRVLQVVVIHLRIQGEQLQILEHQKYLHCPKWTLEAGPFVGIDRTLGYSYPSADPQQHILPISQLCVSLLEGSAVNTHGRNTLSMKTSQFLECEEQLKGAHLKFWNEVVDGLGFLADSALD